MWRFISALVVSAQLVLAQAPGIVKGIVVTDSGVPIAKVSVGLRTQAVGTNTDANGYFELASAGTYPESLLVALPNNGSAKLFGSTLDLVLEQPSSLSLQIVTANGATRTLFAGRVNSGRHEYNVLKLADGQLPNQSWLVMDVNGSRKTFRVSPRHGVNTWWETRALTSDIVLTVDTLELYTYGYFMQRLPIPTNDHDFGKIVLVRDSSKELSSSASVGMLLPAKSISTCQGTGPKMTDIITKACFDSLFPKRNTPACVADGNAIYTYENFVTAAAKWPSFGTTGTDLVRRRELAGFFAHWVVETGITPSDRESALCYVQERCAVTGTQACKTNYNIDYSGSYPPTAGQYYYGRGPKQLSWPGNYGWFSEQVYNDKKKLLDNPNLLATDGVIAFQSSLWFWNQRQDFWTNPQPPKLHDVMVNNTTYSGHSGFEATTYVINGALECKPNSWPMRYRASAFVGFQYKLGIPAASVDTNNVYCLTGATK